MKKKRTILDDLIVSNSKSKTVNKPVDKSVKPTKTIIDPKTGQYKPGVGVDKNGESYEIPLTQDQINHNLNKQHLDTRKKVQRELQNKLNFLNKKAKERIPRPKNTSGYDAKMADIKKRNQDQYNDNKKYYKSKGASNMVLGDPYSVPSHVTEIQNDKNAGLARSKSLLNLMKGVGGFLRRGYVRHEKRGGKDVTLKYNDMWVRK